ncbi:hypothetical protein M427DRAFT_133779 [Gonapodya prolifera JEL478]|uniref:GDS1 winged helix domain-containing protein n=1 Tax=Gonapodya prolifera (strain JEL478) TaxID=1344416 RepID=A0A139AJP4_GONPJ|nr:hypothetical protein M427DRAFT_133779 [Gonapodya prolifera JEL478]|eukprot:KXS17007.1 hypothetical protein M427DRAFT_133779 [Gonapodya prolifera JEL478]
MAESPQPHPVTPPRNLSPADAILTPYHGYAEIKSESTASSEKPPVAKRKPGRPVKRRPVPPSQRSLPQGGKAPAAPGGAPLPVSGQPGALRIQFPGASTSALLQEAGNALKMSSLGGHVLASIGSRASPSVDESSGSEMTPPPPELGALANSTGFGLEPSGHAFSRVKIEREGTPLVDVARNDRELSIPRSDTMDADGFSSLDTIHLKAEDMDSQGTQSYSQTSTIDPSQLSIAPPADTALNVQTIKLHREDARDKVLVAIVRALAKTGNVPATPKELSTLILKGNLCQLGGFTPYATVSSRMSQHFKRCGEGRRAPILGKWSLEGDRKLRYYILYEDDPELFPYVEVPEDRLKATYTPSGTVEDAGWLPDLDPNVDVLIDPGDPPPPKVPKGKMHAGRDSGDGSGADGQMQSEWKRRHARPPRMASSAPASGPITGGGKTFALGFSGGKSGNEHQSAPAAVQSLPSGGNTGNTVGKGTSRSSAPPPTPPRSRKSSSTRRTAPKIGDSYEFQSYGKPQGYNARNRSRWNRMKSAQFVAFSDEDDDDLEDDDADESDSEDESSRMQQPFPHSEPLLLRSPARNMVYSPGRRATTGLTVSQKASDTALPMSTDSQADYHSSPAAADSKPPRYRASMLSSEPLPTSSSAIYRSEDEASTDDGEGFEENPLSVIKRFLAAAIAAPAAEDEADGDTNTATESATAKMSNTDDPKRDDISDFGDELAMHATTATTAVMDSELHLGSKSPHIEPSTLIRVEGPDLEVPPMIAPSVTGQHGQSPVVHYHEAQTPSRLLSLGTPLRFLSGEGLPITPALGMAQPWAASVERAGTTTDSAPSSSIGTKTTSHTEPGTVTRRPEEITLDEVAGLLSPPFNPGSDQDTPSDYASIPIDATGLPQIDMDPYDSAMDSADDDMVEISAPRRAPSRSASAASANGSLRSMKILFPAEELNLTDNYSSGGSLPVLSLDGTSSGTTTPRSRSRMLVTVSPHPTTPSTASRPTSRPGTRAAAEILVSGVRFAPFPTTRDTKEDAEVSGPLGEGVGMLNASIGLPDDFVRVGGGNVTATSTKENLSQLSNSVRKAVHRDDEQATGLDHTGIDSGRTWKKRKVEQSNMMELI